MVPEVLAEFMHFSVFICSSSFVCFSIFFFIFASSILCDRRQTSSIKHGEICCWLKEFSISDFRPLNPTGCKMRSKKGSNNNRKHVSTVYDSPRPLKQKSRPGLKFVIGRWPRPGVANELQWAIHFTSHFKNQQEVPSLLQLICDARGRAVIRDGCAVDYGVPATTPLTAGHGQTGHSLVASLSCYHVIAVASLTSSVKVFPPALLRTLTHPLICRRASFSQRIILYTVCHQPWNFGVHYNAKIISYTNRKVTTRFAELTIRKMTT